MTTLKRKMAKGAAWLVLFKLLERGIGLISTLFLARLLVPADFGLVAMAMSILAALELLSSFSFDLALIQNQNAERRHYDTAWSFALMFGVANALVMCIAASFAAVFFDEPRVEGLMYALALVPLIQGFENVGVVAFQKDLELHKEFMLGLTKKLVGFAVTIFLAFMLHNYWALVAGIVATRVTGLILSYVLHPFRPRFSLNAANELFQFSKWMLLNNVLIFLNNRGTDFVIGKLSGARALGLYSVSYELANLPTTELVFPISRAVFPGYARLADDPEQLRRAFLQVIGLVALLTIPAGVGIGLVAEPLVELLLGLQWVEAVPLIQILAVFGVIRSLHGPMGSIYLALGKPRIIAALQCMQLLIAITLMLLFVPRFGPIGAAWAILVGAFVAMMSNYFMVLRELSLPFFGLMAVIWRPVVASFAMTATLITVSDSFWANLTGTGPTAMRLAAMIVVGAVSYATVILGCWHLAGRPRGTEMVLWELALARFRRSY
jgi:lipopolysaccharide exporter